MDNPFTRATLACPSPCARQRATPRGHPSSRSSTIESRTRRTQEGLPRCGAVGETPGRAGAHLELCARRRATALAHRDAPQVPGDLPSRATPESAGGPPRGSAHQGIECRLGPTGRQRPSDAASARRRRNQSGRPSNCAMPSTRPRRCIRSTVDCSRSRWKTCA